MQRRNGRLPGRSDWQRRHIIFRACDHPPTFQLHHARTTPRVREGIALRCVWKESGRKVYVFHPSFYGWPIFWRKTAQNADTRCKPCLLYRPFPRTRAKHLAGSIPLMVVFYGSTIFCCKTAQFSETPRKSVYSGPALKNRLRNIAKTCAKSR